MQEKNIFERDKSGEVSKATDPGYKKILEIINEAQRIIAELNTGYTLYKDKKSPAKKSQLIC